MSSVVLFVRQNDPDVAVLSAIIDATNQPIVISADVENMLVADDIGGAEGLLQIVEALIGTGLD